MGPIKDPITQSSHNVTFDKRSQMVATLLNIVVRDRLPTTHINLLSIITLILHQDDPKRSQELQGPSRQCDVDTIW